MAKRIFKSFINLEPVSALPSTDIDEGDLVYVAGTGLYIREASAWRLLGSGGGGSGDATQTTVTQTAHGFSVGEVLRHNGTIYVLSQANTAANAEVIGIVGSVVDANTFVLVTGGFFNTLSGLTPGELYFLSSTSAGDYTITAPSAAGEVSKPIFAAVSATAGFFLNYRGIVIPALTSSLTLTALSVTVPSPVLEYETTIAFPGLTSASKVIPAWDVQLPSDENEGAEEYVYVMLIPSTDNLTIRLVSKTTAVLFGVYKLLITTGA